MEIAALAATTVKNLAPALPVILADTEANREIGKKTGAPAVEAAQKFWQWLQPNATTNPELLEAVRDVAANPENEDLQIVLKVRLRKLLEAHPKLGSELEGIVSQIPVEGKANIAASRDIHARDINIQAG